MRADSFSETVARRMRTVLDAEAAAIRAVALTPAFFETVEILFRFFRPRDKVLTTGMGKAGHVARKFAATLCSTGTPATYVHPGEAAHGDAGIVGPGDCIVAFSTSGKTREVLDFLRSGRDLGTRHIVGITSHPETEFGTLCSLVLDMGVIEEPCPLGLTPSASTAVMLAIGDALALALMEIRHFTREDFGRRHHGGYLGQVANGK